MSWCAVDVEAPPETRDAVAAWLVARTGEAIEERPDGCLVGFLPSEEHLAGLRLDLDRAFGNRVRATARPIEMVDWSERWREGLGPRRFGRLIVSPTWAATAPSGGATVTLSLDPEMAFGSGEHGSTRAALTLLERHLAPGAVVLDLGSGSGILAIAAVLLGARVAVGIEVDDEAIPVAVRNAERNGVADRVRFIEGDAAALAPLLGPADMILSNILRSVNVAMLPAIRRALGPGGMVIFSGMEEAEAPVFRSVVPEAGLRIVAETVDAGWWAVAVVPG